MYRSTPTAQLLKDTGCVMQNLHMVLKSGRHTSSYVNLDPAFSRSDIMQILGWRIANDFRFDHPIDIVAAPATGGISLAVYTSLNIRNGLSNHPAAIWADKVEEGFVLERGFAKAVSGKQVLAVEDMLTTGSSLREVITLVKTAGGNVMGAACVCNRGEVTAHDLGSPYLASLCQGRDLGVDLKTFEPGNCPMCAAREPIVTDIGHGLTFANIHPDYAGGFRQLA